MSESVARVSAGDLSQPIPVRGNDAIAQLAESHNRLAADADRRTRQLSQILDAVEAARPGSRRGRARGAGRPRRARRRSGSSRPRSHSSIPTSPARGADPGRVGADPRRTAGRRRADGLDHRSAARDTDLDSRRSVAPRPVCERDRGRDPKCAAVRPGRVPERAASDAVRGEGRFPARRQPQPPDTADTHPGERRSPGGRIEREREPR